jgi:hypothetical protein
VEGEGGLVLCSWPRGGRPRYPFPYSDECWTGIEYEVAALLIHLGLVEEGLEIVEGVRARYDGQKRNPFDEVECGHHYARAMSSWSLLLALSGYRYHAPSRTLGFAPPQQAANPFRCFFAAGTGWGLFSQSREGQTYRASVEVRGGHLDIEVLSLPLPAGDRRPIRVTLDGAAVEATVDGNGIRFGSPLTVSAGGALVVAGE